MTQSEKLGGRTQRVPFDGGTNFAKAEELPDASKYAGPMNKYAYEHGRMQSAIGTAMKAWHDYSNVNGILRDTEDVRAEKWKRWESAVQNLSALYTEITGLKVGE